MSHVPLETRGSWEALVDIRQIAGRGRHGNRCPLFLATRECQHSVDHTIGVTDEFLEKTHVNIALLSLVAYGLDLRNVFYIHRQ
jgi:hypothetical protein